MSPSKQLIGAVVIAVALFLVWMLLVPQYQKIMAYRNAISERQGLLTERAGILEKIKTLNQQARTKIGDIQKFSSVVPTKKDEAGLISAFDRIAQNLGVELPEISLATTMNTKQNLSGVSVSLKLTGTYDQMIAFLDSIETNIRLLDISDLTAAPTAVGSTILNFNLNATAYFIQ